MELTTSIGTKFLVDWDMGTEMMAALLSCINTVSKSTSIKRLDGEGFKVYWAGTILRVDIEEKEVK